ncbi:MAG: rhomboid family intramembrane serine protease [Bacteroidia bacterium]
MFPIRDSIPTRRFPLINSILIGVNVLVFLFQVSLDGAALEGLIRSFALVPADYLPQARAGQGLLYYYPLLTNMFLHGGWLHLIGNVWTLYIFGDNVEDRMGRGRYLLFYLLAGVLAAATHLAFNWGSPVPALGASGAIAGVMGAYLFLCPRSRVLMLIPIFYIPFFFRIPAFVYLIYWFVLQVLSGAAELFAPEATGGIAFWAHIGGFVAGVLLHLVMQDRTYVAPDTYQSYKQDPRVFRQGRWEDVRYYR